MRLFILISIILILFAGCIGEETNPIKDTAQVQENQGESDQSVQNRSDLIEENNSISGSGDEIRDAVLEALEKSNRSEDPI